LPQLEAQGYDEIKQARDNAEQCLILREEEVKYCNSRTMNINNKSRVSRNNRQKVIQFIF
jgi:hypothetical protein